MDWMLHTFLASIVWTTGAAVDTRQTPAPNTCQYFGEEFERVYTVPGEAAMVNCSLVDEAFFDFINTPYNITWYNQRTQQEITEESRRTIIRGTTLWIINSTTENTGRYECYVRTAGHCYRKDTVMQVDQVGADQCHRPRIAPEQTVTAMVADKLICPVQSYIKYVDSYSIKWYKGCDLLQDEQKYLFRKKILHLLDVTPEDAGLYTCRMTFDLGGNSGVVAETVECIVEDKYSLRPQVIEPANEVIKAPIGSTLSKRCRVFVPGEDFHSVAVVWKYVSGTNAQYVPWETSARFHQKQTNETQVKGGFWLERDLWMSEVLQDDFNQTFTCQALSSHGSPEAHFLLLPADPDLRLAIGLPLGAVAVLFMLGAALYWTFKVELTLAFRSLLPFLYRSKDGDGKQYDAYVAYPQGTDDDSSRMAEMFALTTLPQVLEGHYGYKLFILGRDSVPGDAVVDAVEESMGRCRRLLLLYTASSMCGPEGVQWTEQRVALHRALLEDSLRVVLLELDEVWDPTSLPKSVRYLRERQGALQAWRRRRRGWGWWRTKAAEDIKDRQTRESLTSLAPSTRFWRQLRYHMPVRGKAKPRSSRTTLLNL